MPGTTAAARPVRWPLLRSAAVLGAALMAANASNYFLAVAGSHRLSTSSYGLLSALLAVLLVASVPALALQAVVARRTATERLSLPGAVRLGLLTGGISVVVGVAALPGLVIFLHVPHHGIAVVWAVAGLLPVTVLGAVQGHLQGDEAFGRLSVLVLVVGLGRLVGGLVPLETGSGPTGVMAGVTVGAAVAALVALRLSRVSRHPPVDVDRAVAPELVAATLSLGALLLLSNLDLLLARHLLPSGGSGHYAAGNIVAKVAFWLPQAVPLTALPQLSRAANRERALREAAALTVVIAAISVAVTAAAGPTLTRLTFGDGYAGIGHLAWLFAVQGSVLAGVQLLIVDDIANRRRTTVPLVLAASVIETVVLLAVGVHSPRPLITVAVVVAVGLAVASVVRVRIAATRSAPESRATSENAQCAASAQL